ncbi:WD repeat protein [Pseudohyphozyma bogoriensis]|nr:WD repeat protein [Pseudohyphozyma bogoriensis]
MSFGEPDMDELDALFGGGSSEDDSDYQPATEGESEDADINEGDSDDDNDDVAMDDLDDQEDGDEEATGGAAGAGTSSFQIAYDASRLTAADLVGSSLTLGRLRAMLEARFGRSAVGGDEDDEEEEDEDEDEEYDDGLSSYWGNARAKQKQWYEPVTEPVAAGVRLERSGDWGPPPVKYSNRKLKHHSKQLPSLLRDRELGYGRSVKSTLGDYTIPNSAGTEVSQFQSKVYSGQYSEDGSFFYTACQDFKVYIYDTRTGPLTGKKSVTDTPSTNRRGRGWGWEHRSSMKTRLIVKAQEVNCRWTITDANLSPENDWLLYSSITPYVHLVRTRQGEEWDTEDHDQHIIWSIRFSNDAREVVAGGSTGHSRYGPLFVYDIETRKTVLRVNAHQEDVNAVAFADTASGNLLLSGSDDSFVKVWDRRSLSGQRASGTLVGHTEGITFVAPKGDGRYCLSNGKDQAVKLWDLRMMMDGEEFHSLRLDRKDFGIQGWDYRQPTYSKPRYFAHPNDGSVMTYRGHQVLRTLIRCHFSPASTTDQRYIYSGSADGKIHIWSLDGRVAQVLDRRQTRGLINSESGEYNDPSDPDDGKQYPKNTTAVRDVSWHPFEPSLMSTAWGGHNRSEGSLAKHQWKARVVGETIEDQAERMVQESRG